jgi:hypothetical protein
MRRVSRWTVALVDHTGATQGTVDGVHEEQRPVGDLNAEVDGVQLVSTLSATVAGATARRAG